MAPTCKHSLRRSIGFKELVPEHLPKAFVVHKIRMLSGPDPRHKWSKHLCTGFAIVCPKCSHHTNEDDDEVTSTDDMSHGEVQRLIDMLMQEQQERTNANAAQHTSAKHEAQKKNRHKIAQEPREVSVARKIVSKKTIDDRGAKRQKKEQGVYAEGFVRTRTNHAKMVNPNRVGSALKNQSY